MNKDGYRLIELKLFAQAVDWGQPMQQALWLQDGRIRVDMNGIRVIDVNQVGVDMAKVAYFRFASVYLEFEDVSEFMDELKYLVRSRGERPRKSKKS